MIRTRLVSAPMISQPETASVDSKKEALATTSAVTSSDRNAVPVKNASVHDSLRKESTLQGEAVKGELFLKLSGVANTGNTVDVAFGSVSEDEAKLRDWLDEKNSEVGKKQREFDEMRAAVISKKESRQLMTERESGGTTPFEKQAKAKDMGVDYSSLFKYLDVSAAQSENRLHQLTERLELLKVKKEELAKQIEENDNQKNEIETTRRAVDDALKNDKPLSEGIVKALEGLGVAGVVGGFFLGLPVVSAIGALLGGLSVAYREKLRQARNELDRKMAEKNESAEVLKSELNGVNSEQETVVKLIEKEKQKLEQRFDEQRLKPTLVTAKTPWQEAIPTESVIRNNDVSSSVPFDSTVRKFDA